MGIGSLQISPLPRSPCLCSSLLFAHPPFPSPQTPILSLLTPITFLPGPGRRSTNGWEALLLLAAVHLDWPLTEHFYGLENSSRGVRMSTSIPSTIFLHIQMILCWILVKRKCHKSIYCTAERTSSQNRKIFSHLEMAWGGVRRATVLNEGDTCIELKIFLWTIQKMHYDICILEYIFWRRIKASANLVLSGFKHE